MAEQIQFEGQEPHLLIDGVVKVAGDPIALPLQQLDQLAGEGPEVLAVSFLSPAPPGSFFQIPVPARFA